MYKIVAGCIGIFFVIGAMLMLLFEKALNQETWNNVWNILGNTTGAGIGGYIAYKIAEGQYKTNWKLTIKSMFLQQDITSYSKGLATVKEMLTDLNELPLSMPTSANSKTDFAVREYELFKASALQAYADSVNKFNKKLPTKKMS